MKTKKKVLDTINRCYSVGGFNIAGESYILFASEAEGGACYAYSGEDFLQKEVVWEHGGGTMSLVQVPGKDGEILATQNFFPGFNASQSKIVWIQKTNQGWEVKDFLTIPYLHRFDVLRKNGINYFIGATLCRSKRDREDWSDPGDILIGILPDSPEGEMPLTVLKSGLVKNHGYWRGGTENNPIAYITSEQGMYAVQPPETPEEEWSCQLIMDMPVSDAAVFDLDQDGEEEFVVLRPFHGDHYEIRKKDTDGKSYPIMFAYPNSPVFSHVAWAGDLAGTPTVVGGYRRENAELFIIRYDKESKTYKHQVLDSGFGPSNAAVIQKNGVTYIAVANNLKHEAALYQVFES